MKLHRICLLVSWKHVDNLLW